MFYEKQILAVDMVNVLLRKLDDNMNNTTG